MLTITLPKVEMFDEKVESFVDLDPVVVTMEHSLVSLSKWESKYKKSFLNTKDKSNDEIADYIDMMVIEPEGLSLRSRLTQEHTDRIKSHIDDSHTATTFANVTGPPSREIVTAELIYYWMVSYQIPFECQHWHLNRLVTLIQVCSRKNTPPKKMSRASAAARQRELNAQRLAQYGTSG